MFITKIFFKRRKKKNFTACCPEGKFKRRSFTWSLSTVAFTKFEGKGGGKNWAKCSAQQLNKVGPRLLSKLGFQCPQSQNGPNFKKYHDPVRANKSTNENKNIVSSLIEQCSLDQWKKNIYFSLNPFDKNCLKILPHLSQLLLVVIKFLFFSSKLLISKSNN